MLHRHFPGGFLRALDMQDVVFNANETFCIIEISGNQHFQKVSPDLAPTIPQKRLNDLGPIVFGPDP